MKKLDGDIVFITQVAAVSCAETAVPAATLAIQRLRKTLFPRAFSVECFSPITAFNGVNALIPQRISWCREIVPIASMLRGHQSCWFSPEIFGPDPGTEYNPAIIRRRKLIPPSLLHERRNFQNLVFHRCLWRADVLMPRRRKRS
jgi:hypothetical protein